LLIVQGGIIGSIGGVRVDRLDKCLPDFSASYNINSSPVFVPFKNPKQYKSSPEGPEKSGPFLFE
jgi:hypothetical protein